MASNTPSSWHQTKILWPSPRAVQAITLALSKLHRYPDGRGHDLTVKLSNRLGFSPEHFVLGNGSDDLIGMLTRALLQPGDEAIIPTPSFLMYDIDVRSAGAIPVHVPLRSLAICANDLLERVSSRTRMVFICNPNNPTGTVMNRNDFETFIRALPPGIVVVVDEAYMEFVRDPDCVKSMEYIQGDKPVVALRTFSKAYGLAGLRIGYGVMAPELAGILHRIRQPFNASLLAQAGAVAALEDESFLTRTVLTVHQSLDYLYAELDRIGIRYFHTQANFFLIDAGRMQTWFLKTCSKKASSSVPCIPTAIRNTSASTRALRKKTNVWFRRLRRYFKCARLFLIKLIT